MKTGEPVDSILARQKAAQAGRQTNKNGISQKKAPEKKGFAQEVTLLPDSNMESSGRVVRPSFAPDM